MVVRIGDIMAVEMFGNINGMSYQPTNIDLFEMAKEQNHKPVRFQDTPAGKNMPAIKVSISPEGLRASQGNLASGSKFPGSKFPGSIDIKAEQEKMKYYSEHQPIESFRNRLARTMQEEMTKLEQSNPGRGISLSQKEEILMKGFQGIVDEISAGYDDGSRIRFAQDAGSEDGYRRLSKQDELSILQQEFDDFVNARFGEQHQKESEEVAKALSRLQEIKQERGMSDIRYYQPEKIPNGFVEKILQTSRRYVELLG